MVKVIPSKDRREKIIQLTEIGEELYKVCRKRITELEHNMMKGLTENEQIITFETLIARIFSGRYIDQVGLKKMLYISFTCFLITTCLYVLVNTMGFLLINRFLNGAAMGIASTATGTIVAKIIPHERRGEGTGYYALSLTIAAAIGPFLGMFITEHATFYMNFIVCILFLAFSFIAVFLLSLDHILFRTGFGH